MHPVIVCIKFNTFDITLGKFASGRSPGEDLVIDESMMPFRGRLKFKQYIPRKYHKYGIKVYGIKVFKLCDSSGYTYNMKVYSVKEEQPVRDLATSVVMRLTDSYLDTGRTLSTDNFYTSVPLAEMLLTRKTHLVCTLRKNRKSLPKKVVTANLKVGETMAEQNRCGVVVQKWRDKREVLTLSTKHFDAMVKATGDKREKTKPEMVVYYNATKQGIDVSDQLASYHTCLRKTISWYPVPQSSNGADTSNGSGECSYLIQSATVRSWPEKSEDYIIS